MSIRLPWLTADALREAIAAHRTVEGASAALKVTRQAVHLAAKSRPELRDVLDEAAAQRRAAAAQRDGNRQLGEHRIVLADEVIAALDARCALRAVEIGPKAASRSGIARELLAAALTRPLPPPEPTSGGRKITLDIGPVWDAVAARIRTAEVPAVADRVRAILRHELSIN